ncbi:MAG TPA: glycoside hydrolase family 127 protein, partial [Puia sp.]|nr:glycoside hydrolase family 127 protein [Puia sp.]
KGYASIKRIWKKNDQVEMILPMEVRKIVANPKIPDDIGKIALQRGPLVYCAEWVDNFGKTSNIILKTNTSFTKEYRENLLNGVVVLKADASAVIIKNEDDISTVKQSFTVIPYYSWANRGNGEMMVWFPTRVDDVELLTK